MRKLHPQTLAIRGSKEQTPYNEHHQALFLSSSFMFDTAADGAALVPDGRGVRRTAAAGNDLSHQHAVGLYGGTVSRLHGQHRRAALLDV